MTEYEFFRIITIYYYFSLSGCVKSVGRRTRTNKRNKSFIFIEAWKMNNNNSKKYFSAVYHCRDRVTRRHFCMEVFFFFQSNKSYFYDYSVNWLHCCVTYVDLPILFLYFCKFKLITIIFRYAFVHIFFKPRLYNKNSLLKLTTLCIIIYTHTYLYTYLVKFFGFYSSTRKVFFWQI